MTPRLGKVIAELQTLYGDGEVRERSPFEMVLLENVAYLVDDATRERVFANFAQKIGVTAEKILRHTPEGIAKVIEDGGMKPLMRAEKVLEAARVLQEIGAAELASAIETDPRRAKRLLQRFPSIGEPYADRILLFAGNQTSLAPDSNALRVLCRLGFANETNNYSATYRAAVAATASQLKDIATARRAHLLLRRHGQELCKRSRPRCEACPLRPSCAWYSSRTSG